MAAFPPSLFAFLPCFTEFPLQTNCTKNEDSLYFNSRLPPPPSNAAQTWPEVVTSALAEADEPDASRNYLGMAGNSKKDEVEEGDAPVSQLIDIDLPPPLPPKTRDSSCDFSPQKIVTFALHRVPATRSSRIGDCFLPLGWLADYSCHAAQASSITEK